MAGTPPTMQMPSCAVDTNHYCFVDSTRGFHDYGMNATAYAPWVTFGATNDSLEFFAQPFQPSTDESNRRTAEPQLVGGGQSRAWGGPKGHVAARLLTPGSYSLMINFFNGGEDEMYVLSLGRIPGSSAFADRLAPTGEHAWLTIKGDSTGWFALIPNSVAAEVPATDYKAWAIGPDEHAIMLVRDSVYRISRLPCDTLGRIVLRPNSGAVWKVPRRSRPH